MPRYSSRISCSLEAARPPRNPELAPHPLMQALGERLREPVRERLQENRAVVVVRALEALDVRLDADAR